MRNATGAYSPPTFSNDAEGAVIGAILGAVMVLALVEVVAAVRALPQHPRRHQASGGVVEIYRALVVDFWNCVSR